MAIRRMLTIGDRAEIATGVKAGWCPALDRGAHRQGSVGGAPPDRPELDHDHGIQGALGRCAPPSSAGSGAGRADVRVHPHPGRQRHRRCRGRSHRAGHALPETMRTWLTRDRRSDMARHPTRYFDDLTLPGAARRRCRSKSFISGAAVGDGGVRVAPARRLGWWRTCR